MSKKTSGLDAFKVSDNQTSTRKPSGKPKATQQPAAPSAGFPTIEKLIEQENPDLSGFQARMEQLKDTQKNGSAQEKGAARKAVAAYERTQDLIEYLWQTKANLAATNTK